jgi:hypothetical protein
MKLEIWVDGSLEIMHIFLAHLAQSAGELLGWPTKCVRRPSTFLFKQHLLQYHLANINETWQEYSLYEALSRLFKECHSMLNSGCYGN